MPATGLFVGLPAVVQLVVEIPDLQTHFNNIMYKDHGREIINVEGCMPYFNISRPQSRGCTCPSTPPRTAAPRRVETARTASTSATGRSVPSR